MLVEIKRNTRRIKKDGEIGKSATCETSKMRWECDQVVRTRVLFQNDFVCHRASTSKNDDDRVIRATEKGKKKKNR